MHYTELAERLQLPKNTNGRNFASRALRQHVAGGAELLAAKEWAAGVANSARRAAADPSRRAYVAENDARRQIAEQALDKLASIESALLTAIERVKDLPAGSLLAYQRGGAPE